MKTTLFIFVTLIIITKTSFAQLNASFKPYTTYPVGNSPASIIASDFNNDGKTDIATANSLSNDVSILFGDSSGIYSTAVNYPVGNSPKCLVSAFINNDAFLDIAIVNNGSDNLSVLLNNGYGIFSTINTYYVGSSPSSLMGADVNGDGNIDISVTHNNIDSISVLHGSSSGLLSTPVNYASGQGGISILPCFYQGTFLAYTISINNISNTINYFNSGDFAGGAWITPIEANVQSGYFGDFFYSSSPDLVLGYSNFDSVSVFRGDPSFSPIFSNKKNYKTGKSPSSILLADFNVDGMVDIITASALSDSISILYGDPTAIFSSPHSVYVGGQISGLAISDVNLDGKPDVIASNNTFNSISVLLSNTSNTLTLAASKDTICIGESVMLSVSEPVVSCNWMPGNFSSASLIVSPSSTTTYTVNAITTSNSVATATITVYVNNFTIPTLSLTSSNVAICRGASATLSISGATSYVWSTYETGTDMVTVNPYYTSDYWVTGYDNNNCATTASLTISVSPGVDVAFNDTSICIGQNINLVAFSSNSYTWSSGENTTNINVSPNSNITYSVTGIDNSNCVYTQTISIQTISIPTISLNAPTDICEGSSGTIYAYGASSYSLENNQFTNSIVVSPVSSSSYTVWGSNNGYCISSQTLQINVLPSPTISIVGLNNLCPGTGGVGLKAYGATSYTWNTGAITDSIFVSPNASTTYTVIGEGLNNCKSIVTKDITVLPQMEIQGNGLGGFPNSVCYGSSINLFLVYANTYTWSTGENTSYITVSPSVTTSYSVFAADTSGCSSFLTVTVSVNPNCQYVWPGDANSDGFVDQIDFLELCLHLSETGPPRTGGLNPQDFWLAHYADNWTGIGSNGQNLNHVDCNGDGIISSDDTLAIYNYCGYNHPFKLSQVQNTTTLLNIVADQNSVDKGKWGTSSIYLGDANNVMSNVNGLAYSLTFDSTIVEKDSIYLTYQNSFIDVGQNLYFRKTDFSKGILYTATAHLNNTNVSGYGKIATLHYKIRPDLTANSPLNLSITQAVISSASGSITPITSGASTIIAIGVLVGIKDYTTSSNLLMYPNPTSEMLNVELGILNENSTLFIYNALGALVLKENINSKHTTINTSNFAKGLYLVELQSNNQVLHRAKILKQ